MGCTDCFFECSHKAFDLPVRLGPIRRNFSMLKSKETCKVCKFVAIEGGPIVRFDDFGYSLSRENTIEFGDNGVGSCGMEDFDLWKSAEFVNDHK